MKKSNEKYVMYASKVKISYEIHLSQCILFDLNILILTKSED